MWQQVGLKVWSNLSSTVCLWASSPFMARYQSELRGITRRSGVFSTCFSGVTFDHAPKWRACHQAMIWLILDHKSWFRSSQMNPPLGCSCTCYFFTLDREQSRTSVRGKQAKPWGTRAKAPGRSQPQPLLLFIINLTNLTFSLAACGPVERPTTSRSPRLVWYLSNG